MLTRASIGVAATAALALAGCTATEDEEPARTMPPSLADVPSAELDFRLESATIEDLNLDDDEDEFVRFTFTREIQEFEELEEEQTAELAVRGFDTEDVVTATSVRLVEEDPRGLLVGFPAGTDLDAFTIAVAEDGVAQDAEGDVNIQNAAELSGADPRSSGRTAAPELVDVAIEQARNRIRYTFDEQLDEEVGNPSRFGFYTPNGEARTGVELVSVEDEVVDVDFDEGAGDMVEDAERPFTAVGAVQDRQGNGNVPGAVGESTAAPDLESIRRVQGSETQFDFTFDESVEDRETARMVLFTEDGQGVTADALESVTGRTVRATFRQIEDFSEQITLAAVRHGAVRGLEAGETPNTIATREINRGRIALGATAGPDLQEVVIDDPRTGRVLFLFDEPVDEDAEPAADRFFAITQSGDIARAQTIIDVGDEEQRFVAVSFPENAVQAIDGFSVDTGAVRDFQGNVNPVASVEAQTGEEGEEGDEEEAE